jgi:Fe-S oxidoreductase
MCPSYMATREEKHSTRGRARLLFEMLHGGPIKDRWKSDAVEDALELCLACKGCKRDCPVDVDMATYKAEFRSHYYRGRLRPRAAYSMGLIYWWARAASRIPGLTNFVMRAPGLGAAVKFAGGLSQQRRMPLFAGETFRDWFARHRTRNPGGPEIVLFPDTFNNFFRPKTAIAAVQVLEAGGWRVTVPQRSLCCGRPLYDWGMLDTADRLLRELLDTLGPALARGVPIVGLEPACVAAFRDEVPALFPHDPRAERLKRQSFMIDEFVDRHRDRFDLPRAEGRKALVQVHCHQHAVLDAAAAPKVLERLGVEADSMPTGCCGMAGSFGFEAEKYDWSVKIAEHALLPRLRAADPDMTVIASGFSCREQIEQLTGRETRHVAEILARSMGFFPPPPPPRPPNYGLLAAGVAVGAGALLGAWAMRRSRRSGSSQAARPIAARPAPAASSAPR